MRDGFRCMLTGMYDDISLKRNPELCQQCCRLGSYSADVDACHILGELTVQGIMSNEVRSVTVSRLRRFTHTHPSGGIWKSCRRTRSGGCKRSWKYTLARSQPPCQTQQLGPVVRSYRGGASFIDFPVAPTRRPCRPTATTYLFPICCTRTTFVCTGTSVMIVAVYP